MASKIWQALAHGVDLRFALAPAPPSETLLAAATAAATWPLHKLAALLVYAKVGCCKWEPALKAPVASKTRVESAWLQR